MNTERIDGSLMTRTNLTPEEVIEATHADLADPTVVRINIYPENRHERREKAAKDRRKPKPQRHTQ